MEKKSSANWERMGKLFILVIILIPGIFFYATDASTEEVGSIVWEFTGWAVTILVIAAVSVFSNINMERGRAFILFPAISILIYVGSLAYWLLMLLLT